MSTDPTDYSDPQDRVDYQVVQSREHIGVTSSRKRNTYFIIVLAVLAFMVVSLLFRPSKVEALERRIYTLEQRVSTLETIFERLEIRGSITPYST